MIVWSGLGFLVAVIGFGCLLGTELFVEGTLGEEYYLAHAWPGLVGCLVGGAIIWFLGQFLNTRGTKTLVDPETGEEVPVRGRHSFFFIPMQYWGPILGVVGIVMLFTKE